MKLLLPFRKAIPYCGYVWLGHSVDDTEISDRFGKFLSEASGPRALVQVQAQLQRFASWSSRVSGRFVDRISIFTPGAKKDVLSTSGFVVWCEKKRQNQKNTVKVMDDPGPEEWTQGNPFRSSWQVVKLFVDKLSAKIPKSGVPIHYSILTQWTWIHSPCSADCFSGIFLF